VNFLWGTLIVAVVTLVIYYGAGYFYGWGFKKCENGVKFVVDTGAGTGLTAN
jgi:hypothetical protein